MRHNRSQRSRKTSTSIAIQDDLKMLRELGNSNYI